MTLSEAKTIADAPNGRDAAILNMAFKRLAATRSNGGVRNSERAMRRLELRLFALFEAIREAVS